MKTPSLIHKSKDVSLSGMYGITPLAADILNWFTTLVLAGLVAGIFILLIQGNIFLTLILVGSLPIVFSSYYFIRRQKLETVAAVLSLYLLTLNTLVPTDGLGIHSINTIAYPVILIVVGLISRRRTVILLTVYTLACIAWLVIGERSGVYITNNHVHSLLGDFVTASIIVVAMVIIIRRLSQTLIDSLMRLQKEAQERETVENNLRQRETILEVVTFAAEQFLKMPGWRSNIDEVLERLGKTLNVTHAYLFEDHLSPQGDLLTSMRYEWTAAGFKSDLGGEYFQNSVVDKKGFEESVAVLKKGDVRIGNASTFNPIEKEDMDSLGVRSILEVPVFVNGKEWGAVGFDDFVQERTWSLAEVDALKIAAGILGGAIQREMADSAVQESERIYRQAIEAAGAVPYYQEYAVDRYKFMGQGIQSITGYAPEEMSSSLWNSIVLEKQLAGELSGLDVEEAMRRLHAREANYWKCDYRIRSRDGQSKWVADSAVELFDEKGSSYGSIGILQDVTDRKLTEANLRKRESILKAITFAAEQFLKTPNWRETIDIVLQRLGNEFNASHAYLFQRHYDEAGTELTSMIYEWTGPEDTSDLGSPDYQNVPIRSQGFDALYEILDSGEPLVASLSSPEDVGRAYLRSIGVKALLEIRISVNGRQWGTIGFDDTIHDREWTSMEMDVIRVAANVLGAAIQRQSDEDALKYELSERRRAERALKFSEEKFSKAFHSTPVFKTIEDHNHVFIDVNDAFLEGFGFERDEVIGNTASGLNIFTGPEERDALRDATRVGNGMLKNFETRFRRRSGEVGVVILSSDRFFVDDIEYTLTTGLDITERKLAEQKYLDIFNNSMDGIFQSTIDGRFLSVNPAMARIYGYDSPKEMLDYVTDIKRLYVHPEQREDVRQRLASGESLIGYETQDYRKDGSMFWASMSVQAIFDENKKALYYEGTVEDISSRKRSEEEREALIQELAKKNAEAETLRETTTIVTSTLDVTEAVQRILEELKRVVQYDSASVWLYDGKIARLVGSNGFTDPLDEGMWFTSNETEPDYQFLTEDLPYILMDDVQKRYPKFSKPPIGYIHGWLSVALKARGKLIGFISLDSREKGRFAELDAHLALNFANQVAVALENARLFSDVQKELEERKKLIEELGKKNAELEQFTYTVSHDLKSPLVTISGFLGYLEQDARSGNIERLKRDTVRIQEAVRKMQRLLNELLELSRIGRMMNVPETTLFDDIVREAVDLVHGRLVEHGVVVQVQPNPSTVYGDRPRLVEVLQNLVDNAAKYMGDQTMPTVEIGQRGTENGMPVYFVRDNGIGIAPEHHERIFGLFNKLDARSEGTGVGLALVKRIVDVHGGRVWVESEIGEGATFFFTLPSKPKPDSVI